MPSAFPLRDKARTPISRRAASLALTVAAHVLLFLLLWRLAPAPKPLDEAPPLSTFDVAPPSAAAPTPAPTPAARARAAPRRAAGGAPPRATTPAAPTPPVPVPPVPTTIPGVIPLDSFGLAAVPRRPGEAGVGTGTGTAGGADSGSVYGPGEGPSGQRLYNAEWQREPTDAELNGYLPRGAPPGAWAMIACRTVADFRVENCRSLGESPIGSGLARAMRQAAWQFRVLPPRIGGKKMIGAWVRIRIDFSRAPAKAP